MPAKRIPTIWNSNYKRNGTKSYVWLMSKYKFNTTKEGPYYLATAVHQQGKFAHGGLHGHAVYKRHEFGEHSKRPHRKHCHRRHRRHHCCSSESGSEEAPSTPPPESGGEGAPSSPSPDSSEPDPSSGAGTASGAASGQQPATTGSGTESSSTPLAVGGRVRFTHMIAKRDAKGESGQITAQDIQLDSEYLCPVQIGTPAQTLMLDFDSGSSDLWVWSTQLDKSTQQSGQQAGHTIFDPTKSSTFKTLQGSTWQIQYGDGSSASGNVGTDNVALGAVTVTNQAVELASTLSQEFEQDSGDGLLGLAWPNINTIKPQPQPTPVANMISQQDISQSEELFTVYLGSWRDANDPDKGQSFYTFGEIDQDALNGQQPAYTPIDNSQGFWMFPSTTCTINGQSVNRPANNTAIADTGTTLCLLDDTTIEAIYKQVPGAKYDSASQGYIFPTSTTADQLPDVALAVGSNIIHLQKEDLAFADAGNGMVFGGCQSRGTNPFDILGDVFLKSCYAIFDQGNQRLGVVQRTEPTQNLAAPPAQQGGGGS